MTTMVISVWWIKSGELLQSCKAHNSPVTSVQICATKAVSCGLDMIVQVVDIIKGDILQTLRGHVAPILAAAFDRTEIISVSSDGEVRYWTWGHSRTLSENHIPYASKSVVDDEEKLKNMASDDDSGDRKDVSNVKHAAGDEKLAEELEQIRKEDNKGALMNRLMNKFSTKVAKGRF